MSTARKEKPKRKTPKESLLARSVEQKVQTLFRSFRKAIFSAMLTKDEAEPKKSTSLSTAETARTRSLRSPLGPRRNPKRRHATSFLDPLRCLRCPNQNPKTSDPTIATTTNFQKNSKRKKSLEFPPLRSLTSFGAARPANFERVSSFRNVFSTRWVLHKRCCRPRSNIFFLP